MAGVAGSLGHEMHGRGRVAGAVGRLNQGEPQPWRAQKGGEKH
jgi:hypothetical protein